MFSLRNASVTVRLGVLAGTAIGAVVLTSGIGVMGSARLADLNNQLGRANQTLSNVWSADMSHDAVHAAVLARYAARDPATRSVIGADDLVPALANLTDSLAQASKTADPAMAASIAALMPAVDAYVASASNAAKSADQPSASAASLSDFTVAFNDLAKNMEVLDAAALHGTEAAKATNDASVDTLRNTFIVAAIGVTVLCLLVLWQMVVWIRRRLATMSATLTRIVGGDLTPVAHDSAGDEFGAMNRQLEGAVGSINQMLTATAEAGLLVQRAADGIRGNSQALANAADRTSDRADGVSGAAAAATETVQSVAVGVEELGAAAREIARNASEATTVGRKAVELTLQADATIHRLGQATGEVSTVAAFIAGIAEQTNLLALNATIEAARAGDAGRGFGVVASEVKDLAQEVAKATGEIESKIATIRHEVGLAVGSIGAIMAVIEQVSNYQTSIASAVEEQSAVTGEVSQRVSDIAQQTTSISRSIADVAEVSRVTTANAGEGSRAADALAELSSQLSDVLSGFRF